MPNRSGSAAAQSRAQPTGGSASSSSTDRLPAAQHTDVVARVAERIGDRGVRYVRLHAAARRAPGPAG